MEISDASVQLIVDEIKFAADKMADSQDALEILYYFSAIFGIIHRVYNIEYNSDLIFAHFVLKATHENFQNRLQAIKQTGDQTVKISDEQFEKLPALSKELAQKISKKEDITATLKKFVILTYSTTGNGYYLMQKGLLKI